MANPNELRFDVRDSFEEFVTGISAVKGPTDERPIQEQALDMLDELALMEQMMNTQTFGDGLVVVEALADQQVSPTEPAPPQYPSFQLD